MFRAKYAATPYLDLRMIRNLQATVFMNSEETYLNFKDEDLKILVSDKSLFIVSAQPGERVNQLTAIQYLRKIHLLFTSGLGNSN